MQAQVARVQASVVNTLRPVLSLLERNMQMLDLPERVRGLIDKRASSVLRQAGAAANPAG